MRAAGFRLARPSLFSTRPTSRSGFPLPQRFLSTSSFDSDVPTGKAVRLKTPFDVKREFPDLETCVSTVPLSSVRNFVIIAHVDAGKSTLSDRLLEATGTLTERETSKGQVMDTLRVERERGITVKAQSACMQWRGHLMNLIDTPGHVDFSWEVRRSLAAAQGAVLLVDSTQGVQAQTIANFNLAKEAGLTIVPALTKLDLRTSDPAGSLLQMENILGIPENQVIWTSARTGEGVDTLLDAVVSRVPAPPSFDPSPEATFCASVVDLRYDQYRGVVCLICVHQGRVRSGDRVVVLGSSTTDEPDVPFEIKEVGVLLPTPKPLSGSVGLGPGRVGYVLSVNSRGAAGAFIGAMVVPANQTRAPLQISTDSRVTQRPKPTVFASCFPIDASDYDDLKRAVNRLLLSDSSVVCKTETSHALGQGFRCGFLGALHMEVFVQRLEDEFGATLICTAPSVEYECVMKDGKTVIADAPSALPDPSKIAYIMEPMVLVTLVAPIEHVGPLMEMLQARRGRQLRVDHAFDGVRSRLVFDVPWAEAVTDLHNAVKGASSGHASFDVQESAPQQADIVRVDILLNTEKAEPLSFIAHRSKAEWRGRQVANKLKQVIPPQHFEITIQACIGGKIVARETIRGMAKNVLGRANSGGDVTRKMKLLKKQKEGKARLKLIGRVQLNQSAFMAVLDRNK